MLKKMVFSLLAASAVSSASQAVVFDWGKVLADPDPKSIVAFISGTLGLTPEEFEKANLRKREQKEIPEMEFWMEFAKERGTVLPDDWKRQCQAVSRAALNVDVEMYALVDELKANGITVALLSNIQRRYADVIRDFGLYAPFRPCLLSSEIGLSKPDPKAYDLLLKELTLPPSEVVFIDDLPQNIEAARSAGIDAIQFESRQQLRKELVRRGLL